MDNILTELKSVDYNFIPAMNEFEERFFNYTDTEIIAIARKRFNTVDADLKFHKRRLLKLKSKKFKKTKSESHDPKMIRAWIKRLKVIPKHKR